jgi:hypothetical protein
MAHPHGLSLIQELSEPLMIVAKDQAPQKRFPCGCSKKGVGVVSGLEI